MTLQERPTACRHSLPDSGRLTSSSGKTGYGVPIKILFGIPDTTSAIGSLARPLAARPSRSWVK
jgi:hypothetical protein